MIVEEVKMIIIECDRCGKRINEKIKKFILNEYDCNDHGEAISDSYTLGDSKIFCIDCTGLIESEIKEIINKKENNENNC